MNFDILEKPRAEREDRDARFREKVAIQQFLNHNAPIFRALALTGADVESAFEGGAAAEMASFANELAAAVAGRVLTKPDPSAGDLSSFRSAAAAFTADAWSAGRMPTDTAEAADLITAAVAQADGSWDHSVFDGPGMTDRTMVAMTAAATAGALANTVAIYDFRLGRERVLADLVAAVCEKATSAAREMLPDDADRRDVMNLTQTLARNLTSLAEATYERVARSVVRDLTDVPVRERDEWLADARPFEAVLEEFAEWGTCLAGFALKAAQSLAPEPTAPSRAP